MKKNDFLKKWAKRASGEKSVEEFERDVESVLATTIRAAMSGVSRGIKEIARKFERRERAVLEQAASVVPPAVERALMKLNGIEDEL
ncbi:MAG: hypothetical protein ACREDF_04110 [Thermoplasmata archaeon]